MYIVVEGNRRLAAVLLLLDDDLRRKLKATDLPDISASRRTQLQRLPVSVYKSRRDLWSYLGFRHINGTRPWDSFSKAKYVAGVHETYGIPLSEIASRIGDRNVTVHRLYRGIKLLQQAEEAAGFDVNDRERGRFFFSHLYTAAQQPEFQKFLGINDRDSLKPNPVPKTKLDNLSELMVWLYGKKSTGTPAVIRSQNPDLNTLREVISKPVAISALRSGYTLASAQQIGIGDARRFVDALTSANEQLRQAKGSVTTGYKGERDALETMGNIVNLSLSIQREMEDIASAMGIARRVRAR